MIRNVRKRIRHPELIDGGHRHPRRQIQIHLAVMLRIRRQNVLAVANRQQVVFAHNPQDSFVIDDHPLTAQIHGDPAVAVTPAVPQDHLLDRRPHRHLRFVRRHYFPVPVIAGAADTRQVAHPFHA